MLSASFLFGFPLPPWDFSTDCLVAMAAHSFLLFGWAVLFLSHLLMVVVVVYANPIPDLLLLAGLFLNLHLFA